MPALRLLHLFLLLHVHTVVLLLLLLLLLLRLLLLVRLTAASALPHPSPGFCLGGRAEHLDGVSHDLAHLVRVLHALDAPRHLD